MVLGMVAQVKAETGLKGTQEGWEPSPSFHWAIPSECTLGFPPLQCGKPLGKCHTVFPMRGCHLPHSQAFPQGTSPSSCSSGVLDAPVSSHQATPTHKKGSRAARWALGTRGLQETTSW